MEVEGLDRINEEAGGYQPSVSREVSFSTAILAFIGSQDIEVSGRLTCKSRYSETSRSNPYTSEGFHERLREGLDGSLDYLPSDTRDLAKRFCAMGGKCFKY